LIHPSLELIGRGNVARHPNHLKAAAGPQSHVPKILDIEILVREKNQQAIALPRRIGAVTDGIDDFGLLPRSGITWGNSKPRKVRRPNLETPDREPWNSPAKWKGRASVREYGDCQ
jgi:hypothetical protein